MSAFFIKKIFLYFYVSVIEFTDYGLLRYSNNNIHIYEDKQYRTFIIFYNFSLSLLIEFIMWNLLVVYYKSKISMEII